jgi:hypothetical protein
VDTVVIASETLKLECKINTGSPEATIKWTRDGKDLKPRKHTTSYENEIATLTLEGTDVKDAGSYQCEAKNKIATVQTTCNVRVIGE